MSIGILTVHLHIDDCHSLKEKRSRIQPVLARLHREFNLSAAELDCQDQWHETVIGCAIVSNDSAYNQRNLQKVLDFIGTQWPDLYIADHSIEII